jgi:hypothetical protein
MATHARLATENPSLSGWCSAAAAFVNLVVRRFSRHAFPILLVKLARSGADLSGTGVLF